MTPWCEISRNKELFTQKEVEEIQDWLFLGIDITLLHIQSEGISPEVSQSIVDKKVWIFVKVEWKWAWAWVGDIITIWEKTYISTAKHVVSHRWVQDILILDFSGEIVKVGKILAHPTLDVAFIEVLSSNVQWYDISKSYTYGEKSITLWLWENHRPHVTVEKSVLSAQQKSLDSIMRKNPFNQIPSFLIAIPNNVKPGDSGSMVVDELGNPKYMLLKWETITKSIGHALPVEYILKAFHEIQTECKP